MSLSLDVNVNNLNESIPSEYERLSLRVAENRERFALSKSLKSVQISERWPYEEPIRCNVNCPILYRQDAEDENLSDAGEGSSLSKAASPNHEPYF